MMMVKRTDSAGAWRVFHRSLGATKALTLSAGAAADATSSTYWNDTAPTSTQFTIGTDLSDNGGTYTAYIWAHNDGDGGFGPDADQDIIKCGTYTGSGGDGNFINLGFEPQWLMLKKYNASQNAFFYVMDAMRGVSSEQDSEVMYWNAVASTFGSQMLEFNPNGFTLTDGANSFNGSGDGYVYMAIRRGPLNTPDTPSKVFNTGAVQNNTNRNIANALTGQQSPDMALWKNDGTGQNWFLQTRLLTPKTLIPNLNNTASASYGDAFDKEMRQACADGTISVTDSYGWMWARAPGFFDVVTYDGTSSAQTVPHNLGVVPEMIWVKSRNNANSWTVFHKDMGNTKRAFLTSTTYFDTGSVWNNTSPTATGFTVGTDSNTNYSGHKFVAYLWASIDGVSKIGSYVGDGTSGRTIDCGFTNGCRFILSKKALNGNGGWLIFDAVRGIVSGLDPYFQLNTDDPQYSADTIDPTSSGFIVNDNNTNANSDTYIFYAIAA
jgi:hypothetical protein